MRRLALIAALAMGCGGADGSRLESGSRVVVVPTDDEYHHRHFVSTEPVGSGAHLAVEVGTTGIVVEDAADRGSRSRDVTVRFDGEPAWTGKIRRSVLRTVK